MQYYILLVCSEAGTNSTALSSGAPSPQVGRHVVPALAQPDTVASPQYQIGYPSMDERERREINNNNMGYEEVRTNNLEFGIVLLH